MMPDAALKVVPKLLDSGHRKGIDTTAKKALFNSTLATSLLADRFERAVDRIGDLKKLPANVGLLCALPRYDAVLTHQGLRAAAESFGGVYAQDEHLVLDWDLSRGWRDRRYLHPVTRSILIECEGPPAITARDWAQARSLLQAALGEPDTRKVWNTYCAAASAWWSRRLPKLLWAHCNRESPLQPLSRRTWARFETGRPLVVTASCTYVSAPDRDAYFRASRQTHQEDAIMTALQIVTDHANGHGSRQSFVAATIAELVSHLEVAAKQGRLQVLLVGFIIDLLANGGELGALGINSIVAYLGATLVVLLKALLKVDLDSLDGEGWWRFYTGLVDAAKVRKGHIQATLTAFHNYIEWLGVPSLPRHLGHGSLSLPPHAEVVWKHEVARAVRLLEPLASKGDRIAQQAILALLLIDAFMVRIEEVFSLRKGDFHPPHAPVTGFIYPRTRDGTIKSDAVRRPFDLSDPILLRYLRSWLAKRSTEGAADEDFLFGTPRQARTRFEHGKTYALMQWALKAASGEPSVGTHGCRHRHASLDGAEALMPGRPVLDVNPIDQISAGGGQAITESTRETYLNIFERPLAAHCRVAWENR